MAKAKELKTNAMRILDKNKVTYEVTMYPCEEFIDGIHVADLLGIPYERCFKTLENPCICPPKAPVCTCGRKPVVRVLAGGAIAPSGEETERNPRARSAKLRVAEKR